MQRKAEGKLSEERKKLIFQAALREFAERGYERASTNSIIKEAGVAKGLLFHYYGSKKDLFLQVVDMAIEHLLSRYEKEMDNTTEDFVERIIALNMWKLKVSSEEPLMQQLLSTAFIDPPEEIRIEMIKREREITERFLPQLTENIDYTVLRYGVDPQKAVWLTMTVVEALGEKYIEKFRGDNKKSKDVLAGFIEELKVVMALVKHGIYK